MKHQCANVPKNFDTNHDLVGKLLSYVIPEGRQKLSRRDAALYALSLDLSQDPLNRHQVVFVDRQRELTALSFMAVVLAPHGFWMADPATGIDSVKVVHGEQTMQFTAPLPLDGEVFGRTRVIDVVNKVKGKGALLYLEKDLVDAATGTLVAKLQTTIFLRGDGGFKVLERPTRATHTLPETPHYFTIMLLTRPEQALLYRLNGDYNPLHSDSAVAKNAGFERPILHGLCTLAVCGHAILKALCNYEPSRLRSLQLRFRFACPSWRSPENSFLA